MHAHAHARALHVSGVLLPGSSAARHARTARPAGDSELDLRLPLQARPAEDGEPDVIRPLQAGPAADGGFDFSRPFLLDIGRAAVIADWLRESGYPRCTADVVIAELVTPERERSPIGRFAADQLERAGWRP